MERPARTMVLSWRYRPGEPGPVWRLTPAIPVGLEIDFDLDEKRDLDRDLHTELALAEEVTDHLGEYAKAAACCLEEFGELLLMVSPVDCVSSRG